MSQTTTQTTSTLAGDIGTLPQQRSASDLDSALRAQPVTSPEGLSPGTHIPAQRSAPPQRQVDEPGQLRAPAVVTQPAGPGSGRSGTQHSVRGLFARFTHSPTAEEVERAARRATRSRHDRVVGEQSDPLLSIAPYLRGMR